MRRGEYETTWDQKPSCIDLFTAVKGLDDASAVVRIDLVLGKSQFAPLGPILTDTLLLVAIEAEGVKHRDKKYE